MVVYTRNPSRAAVHTDDRDARTIVAVSFRNAAIKHMAAKDKNALNEFLEELTKCRPCAVSLRQFGLPFIFNDTAAREAADATDEANKLRTKFAALLRSSRKAGKSCKQDFLAPFSSVTHFQFKQIVDKMEAFVQGGCATPGDPGLFRRLAYHLVINNFTDPQSLEGLTIESCASFLNGPHETTAML